MKRIPIAIVGLNFGRHIIDCLLQNPGQKYFQIDAVCDLDKSKVETFGERLHCKMYTDFDALLDDKYIPALGLFTGPSDRALLLKRIIRAGKDVIITTPFELDARAALDVLREAKGRNRISHLNSPSASPSPDVEQIIRWRDKFDLGRPVACRADVWASYREKGDGSWYDDPKRCPIAPIFRLGIYLINDLIRFFGVPEDVQVLHSRQRPTKYPFQKRRSRHHLPQHRSFPVYTRHGACR